MGIASAYQLVIDGCLNHQFPPRGQPLSPPRTGLEFAFPQSNGDVFAFTEPVNSAFQHCVPRCPGGASAAGPTDFGDSLGTIGGRCNSSSVK